MSENSIPSREGRSFQKTGGNMKQTKRLLICTVCAPLAATAAFSTSALAYPDKPIKLVIPYRAGGGSDSLARTIQAAIQKYKLLPKPLVVVNITGAGGAVGARSVKDAKPDGYTFLQIHNGMFALSATGRLGFGPNDFSPVAQTTQSCLYLSVPASSPYKNIKQLIAAGKANPNKLKFADTIGGVSHFPMVLLMQATGAKFGIVQTGGTSKRFASMKGGHTAMAFMSPGWIKRGGDQLRGLLWMGPTRHPSAPNMPTANELGYNVTACLNRRFWAPKGTPADRVGYFANVLQKVMQTPELVAYHKKRLGAVTFRSGARLKKDIDTEMATFLKVAPVIKSSMMKK
jgi:putative tricarboxylic transport membrane protein